MLENEILDEIANKEINHQFYNLIIGMVLLWGFLINWILVIVVDTQALREINYMVFLLLYFGSCLVGISLFKKSDKPFISFLGYNLVVIPFGLVLNMGSLITIP